MRYQTEDCYANKHDFCDGLLEPEHGSWCACPCHVDIMNSNSQTEKTDGA